MDGSVDERDVHGVTLLESDRGQAVGSDDGTVVFGPDGAVAESMVASTTGDETAGYVASTSLPTAMTADLERHRGVSVIELDGERRIDGYEVIDSDVAVQTIRREYADRDRLEEDAAELRAAVAENEAVRDGETTLEEDERVVVADVELDLGTLEG